MAKSVLTMVIFSAMLAASSLAGETTFYTLDNGMEVILKENHASPLVSSVIIVKAGSKYENEKNNGFTHLLEHMLFNGTETRTREEIDSGIDDYGGYINAFTRQEMTGYLVVMPSEFIEKGLDIQSDQLFHSILPADQFPKERDIVAEEIKKDNDVVANVAYDYFNSVKFAGTPYARPVIGYEETIRKVTREEVMDYYKSYYVPNNMTAFISGDFEIPEMRRLVDKYFGSVPRGPEERHAEFSISPPYGSKIHIKRYPTDVTYIDIALPGPLCGEDGFYDFDFLSQYLNSDASPLSAALTGGDDPLATSVSVDLDIQAEYTMMDISIRTNDAGNIDKAVSKTLDVLRETANRDFDNTDIRRVVIPNKVNDIKLEEKLHYYGIMKAPYLAICGYEFVENYVNNLSKIEPTDVKAAANRYLADPEYVASALAPEKGGK